MVASWSVHTSVLLIYIFATFQEVSLFFNDCGSNMCINSYCCDDTWTKCCFGQPEMPWNADSLWYIPVLAVFGSLIGFSCLLLICIKYFKVCKKSEQPQPQEPTRSQPIPPPPAIPPLPTTPPLMQASEPPPYSEVIGKPHFYPHPMGEPPCYENIAMGDLSSLESAQPPR